MRYQSGTIWGFLGVMVLGVGLFCAGEVFASASSTDPESPESNDSIKTSAITSSALPESGTGVASLATPRVDPVQMGFGVGDVNLHQGTVMLLKTDLVVPGKNGLDVVINRRYDSSRYREKPGNFGFGSGMGRGWSLNTEMRAFVVMRRGVQTFYDAIYIQSSTGVEVYRWNEDKKRFINKNPLNKAIVNLRYQNVFNPSPGQMTHRTSESGQIEMRSEDGRLYTFSLPSFVEVPSDAYGEYEMLVYGYELTSIEDVHGNKVSYSYDHLGGDDFIEFTQRNTDFGYLLPQILGESYKRWYDETHTSLRGITNHIIRRRYRLKKIVDTWGNEIKFEYLLNSFLQNENRFRVGNIVYKNHEGNERKIVYEYSVEHYLTAVSIEGLPKEQYSYIDYLPTYNWRVVGHRIGLFRDFTRDYVFVDYPGVNPGGDEVHSLSNASEMKGKVLGELRNRLGSGCRYYYEDCLVKNGVTGDEVKTDILLEGLSTPVVTKKELIEETGEVWVFEMSYPRDGLGKLKKESYSVLNEKEPTFGFSRVSIDNPKEILDETYLFERGFLVNKLQRNNPPLGSYNLGVETGRRSIYVWNYSRNLKTKELHLQEGIMLTQTHYSYDADNNPIEILVYKGNTPTLKTTTQYSQDPTHRTLYNLIHLPIQQSVEDLIFPQTKVSQISYTPKGQLHETFEGKDQRKIQTMSYYANGLPQSITSYGPGGPMTLTIEYAQIGDRYTISKTLAGMSSRQIYETYTGKVLEEIDHNNQATTYRYDPIGRGIETLYPDGERESIRYSADLKSQTHSRAGLEVTTHIDSLGRPYYIDAPEGETDFKTEYHFGNTPKAIYHNNGSGWIKKKEYAYDKFLRKIKIESPDFGSSTISYDDANLKTLTTDPIGRQQEIFTDELGNIRQSKDLSTGKTITYHRDSFGQLLKLIDPKGNQHKISYDELGRATHHYHPQLPNQNTAPLQTKITFESGAPKTIDHYSEEGALFRSYRYRYDANGRLEAILVNNQPIEMRYYDDPSQSYAKGKLTKVENPDSELSYIYDALGRIIAYSTKIKALDKTLTLQTSYNKTNGNIESTSYPDNKAIRYTYNANHRLSELSYNEGQVKISYTYNPNGSIRTMTYGNGTTITYEYERDILLKRVLAKTKANKILYEQSQTYDTIGRITKISHNDYIHHQAPVERSYTYTDDNELKTVHFNGQLHYTHAYDKTGNHTRYETLRNRRINKDNMIIQEPKNQLKEKHHTDGKTIRLSYDALGNLTQKDRRWTANSPADTTRYSYNADHQISQIEQNTQLLMAAKYDANRQRIMTTMPGQAPDSGTKWYYWDLNGQIIGEGHSEYGDYTVRYLYSGNQKAAMIRPKDLKDRSKGEAVYYFINNPQGTPVLIIDENGNAVSKINLDEWGNIGPMTQGTRAEINYTGKKLDPSTGLFYFNQRYYDPELGRFITHDPAKQGLNPYAYCANNPLMYVDPDGEFWWIVGAVLGAVISGWGKDLSKFQTWGDMALGATIGGITGFALDTALAHGAIGEISMEARVGISDITTNGQFASVGISQTTSAITLGGQVLGSAYALYSVATPLFNEQHSLGYGSYDPHTEQYPVVVETPLFPGADIIDPMMTHTQIIEPGEYKPQEKIDKRKSWSFGPMNSENTNGLMQREKLDGYTGGRILHRFTNIDRYNAAKASAQAYFNGKIYDFSNLKCHNPIRMMIDLTR